MAPIKTAIIGSGLSTRIFHLPPLLSLPSLFTLTTLVQRTPKPLADTTLPPQTKILPTAEDVFSDPEIELVVITTPPDSHFEYCKRALEVGKHVVVEKPFVPSLQEAEALVEVQKRSGKILAVYQNRRWDADFLTLKKILDEGLLGRVVEFETHFDRHRPSPPAATWKTANAGGTGAIYDLGSHLIDQLISLFGLPKTVTGFLQFQREGGTEGVHDSCSVLLGWEDGKGGRMLGTVKAGVVSAEVEEQVRFWVRGTGGTWRKYHLDPQEDQLKAGLRPGDENFAREPESAYGILTTVDAEGKPHRRVYPTVEPATYAEFYRLLAKAIAGEGKNPVAAEEARDVMRVIELAVRSSREGRTLVVE